MEHTLHGITETLERSLFAEEISTKAGLFQSLDPRVKILVVLAFLIAASTSRSLIVLAGLYLLTLILALSSAIPAGFFIKRVWLTLPFFTGLIILPALFITPGLPLLLLPLGLAITRSGVITSLFLLLRVSTSVSLALLLVLTTPWNTVLSALSVLRIPDVFLLILGMTYRYIYLLLHTANDMFLSRKSRVVGRMDRSGERRMLAAISGTLLTKTLDMSGEVYLAMQSRGFRGTIITLKPFKMQPRDWFWLVGFWFAFMPLYILGLMGVTRRLSHFDDPSLRIWFEVAAFGRSFIVDPGREVEQEDVLHGDDVLLHAGNLGDCRHFARAIRHARDLDDHVDRRRDLLPQRFDELRRAARLLERAVFFFEGRAAKAQALVLLEQFLGDKTQGLRVVLPSRRRNEG